MTYLTAVIRVLPKNVLPVQPQTKHGVPDDMTLSRQVHTPEGYK